MFFLILRYFCIAHTIVYCQWTPLFGRENRLLSIDGSWSPWNSWSSCYKNTNNGSKFYPPWENFYVQSSNRTCTAPAPLYGGKECEPPAYRYRQCLCESPLGLSTGRIKSMQITASSSSQTTSPVDVRLSSDSPGWCARSRLSYFEKTFIEIDLKQFTNVNAIETMGNEEGRIVRYKLEYSLNAKQWHYVYRDNKRTNALFKGNLLPGKISRNTFRDKIIMKYLRLIPIESFGKPCLKFELYGCIFTSGKLLTKPFGEISAQSVEEFNQNGLWKIAVLNTTAISFDFSIFYLPCENGYLNFHDGEKPFNSSPVLHSICLQNFDEEIKVLKINLNNIWINFVSNSSSSEASFTIHYFSECEQTIHMKPEESYKIKSPNYPENYLDNLNCKWHIYPPKNTNAFKLLVESFSVESNNDTSCTDDVLIVETEKENISNVYDVYCNSNKPKRHIELVAEKIFFTFKTDLVTSDKGFSIDISTDLPLFSSTTTTTFHETTHNKFSTKTNINSNSSNKSDMKRKKVDKATESDDWTIIIICSFSGLVVLLTLYLAVNSFRRYRNNRSSINAHCAKIAAKNEEREQKEKKEKQRLLLYSPSDRQKKDEGKAEKSNEFDCLCHDTCNVDMNVDVIDEACYSLSGSSRSKSPPIEVNVKICSQQNIDEMAESVL